MQHRLESRTFHSSHPCTTVNPTRTVTVSATPPPRTALPPLRLHLRGSPRRARAREGRVLRHSASGTTARPVGGGGACGSRPAATRRPVREVASHVSVAAAAQMARGCYRPTRMG
jgi:hypothetical protein